MEALEQAFSDFCYNEQEYRLHLRECRQDRSLFYEREYHEKDVRAAMSCEVLQYMCMFAGLEFSSVLSVLKSIRRNSQYQHAWGKEAHFNSDRYFEFENKRPGSIESFCDLCKAEV